MGIGNIRYIVADVAEVELDRYEFISCIASMHHVSLTDTVVRLRSALVPSGVLAVLGLSWPTLVDYLIAVVAAPTEHVHRLIGRLAAPPMHDPELTLTDIRQETRQLLPRGRPSAPIPTVFADLPSADRIMSGP